MPYLGNTPTEVPLSSADLQDSIITSAKIANGTIVNADINASAGIDSTKISGLSSDFVKLLSTSASASSAVSIDGYFTSTYDRYILYLTGGYQSTGNRINMKVNKSGSVQTGDYKSISEYQTNEVVDGALYETDYFHIGYWYSDTTRRNSAIIDIINPLGTSYSKEFFWKVQGQDNAYNVWTSGGGVHNVTSAISGVTILNQSGYNFTIDKIVLYGIK